MNPRVVPRRLPSSLEEFREDDDYAPLSHGTSPSCVTSAGPHASAASPATPPIPIASPRQRGTERPAHSQDVVRRLVLAQDDLRDQIALRLLAQLGLRKNELRLIQYRHIDLAHGTITEFLRQSGNLKLAQMLARHKSIRTTADIYGHLELADLATALQAMPSLFGGK